MSGAKAVGKAFSKKDAGKGPSPIAKAAAAGLGINPHDVAAAEKGEKTVERNHKCEVIVKESGQKVGERDKKELKVKEEQKEADDKLAKKQAGERSEKNGAAVADEANNKQRKINEVLANEATVKNNLKEAERQGANAEQPPAGESVLSRA